MKIYPNRLINNENSRSLVIWETTKTNQKQVALFKDLLIYNTSFYVDHIAFLVFTFIHTELNFIAVTLIDKTQTKGHSMEGIKRFPTVSEETAAHQHSQCTTLFSFFF